MTHSNPSHTNVTYVTNTRLQFPPNDLNTIMVDQVVPARDRVLKLTHRTRVVLGPPEVDSWSQALAHRHVGNGNVIVVGQRQERVLDVIELALHELTGPGKPKTARRRVAPLNHREVVHTLLVGSRGPPHESDPGEGLGGLHDLLE